MLQKGRAELMYNTRSVGAVLMLLVTLLLAYGSYVLSLMVPAGLPPLEPFKYAALIAGSGWGVWLILALMKSTERQVHLISN